MRLRIAGKRARKRIEKIYSHDGPGFAQEVLESDLFQAVLTRIEKTVPQSSLIGMLFENQEDFTIVKSRGIGLLQHDPYSWVVEDGDLHLSGSFDGRCQVSGPDAESVDKIPFSGGSGTVR